jgi:hypothetical protein
MALQIALLVSQLCVTQAPSLPSGAGPPLPLPRSSIAAVLAKRGAIGLTATQVALLEKRDAELQREREAIMERFNPPAKDMPKKAGLTFNGPGKGGGAGGPPGGGPPGGGPGGGGPGGTGGAPPGGGPPGVREKESDPSNGMAKMEQEFDNADTRAWLEVAAQLPPAIEERATEVASQYREALASDRERPAFRR